MGKLSSRTQYALEIAPTDLIHVVVGGLSYKVAIKDAVSSGIYVALAGGGQGGATQLAATKCLIGTCATLGDSVLTIDADVKGWQEIRNEGAATAYIYPQSGQNYKGLATDAYIPLPPGNKIIIESWGTGELYL